MTRGRLTRTLRDPVPRDSGTDEREHQLPVASGPGSWSVRGRATTPAGRRTTVAQARASSRCHGEPGRLTIGPRWSRSRLRRQDCLDVRARGMQLCGGRARVAQHRLGVHCEQDARDNEATTAKASTTFTRSASRTPVDQKWRMPALDREIVATSPETSSSPRIHQAAGRMTPHSPACPFSCSGRPSAAIPSRRTPTAAADRQRPARRTMKARPSKAMDTGNVLPDERRLIVVEVGVFIRSRRRPLSAVARRRLQRVPPSRRGGTARSLPASRSAGSTAPPTA